jgi:tRNA (adenine57-N1/adenine58-N1)-methyltransferase
MDRTDAAFHEGDMAMLIDRKGRRYLVRLTPTGALHTHVGVLPHQEIIGKDQGNWLRTTMGQTFLALKPTLGEYAQHMPRATQVIYPKDLGNILIMADIFPGCRVVEAGLGSGALTMALLQAAGAQGCVTSYEVRTEQVPRVRSNLEAYLGDIDNLEVKDGDIYQGIEQQDVDRVVLDVPEPWQVVGHAADSLKPGGILLCFLPTVLQVHRLAGALDDDRRFQLVETVETLLRPWHVTQQSMRPAHRMVAHSGFITTARRCDPRPGAARPDPGQNDSREEADDGESSDE